MKHMKGKSVYLVMALCVFIGITLLSFAYLNRHDVYHNDKAIAHAQDYYTGQDFIVTPNGDNQWSFSIGELSGSAAIAAFTVDQDSQISWVGTVDTSAKYFKLVLVDVINETVFATLCEGSTSQSVQHFDIPKGEYAIKAVGINANAKGNFTLHF